VSIECAPNTHNKKYLQAKKTKGGHDILNGRPSAKKATAKKPVKKAVKRK
jgi:hypothetical protein